MGALPFSRQRQGNYLGCAKHTCYYCGSVINKIESNIRAYGLPHHRLSSSSFYRATPCYSVHYGPVSVCHTDVQPQLTGIRLTLRVARFLCGSKASSLVSGISLL